MGKDKENKDSSGDSVKQFSQINFLIVLFN